ncbi:MAG: sulfite exporter TauE/SafE family protein [Methanosarcinaceae archaeon]|nr:sulfite exporter TauE/SafE family protein [Methanosarcinaceae archaeon]
MELVSLALYLIITGCIIGFISGLLGVGGGFIMVPVLLWLLDMTDIDRSISTQVVFGTSLAVTAVTAVSGARTHHRYHKIDLKIVVYLATGSIAGAQLGGFLAHNTEWEILRIGFGILLMIIGFLTLTHYEKYCGSGTEIQNMYLLIPAGFAVGTISALFGIGGSIISTPILIFLFCFPIHIAVGISSALIVFTATSGTLSYIILGQGVPNLPPYSIGYVNAFIWLFLVVTSIVMAQIGAKVTHRIDAQKLHRIFGVLLIIIGLRMFQGYLPFIC